MYNVSLEASLASLFSSCWSTFAVAGNYPARNHKTLSMRIWLSTDISDCLINAVNGISLLVWDLNAEFLLNCHDDFHRVQAVQAEVVSEMRGSGNL